MSMFWQNAGDCTLCATLIPMGDDLVVCLDGGASHIGSVSTANAKGECCTIVQPSHRDNVIGERYTTRLQQVLTGCCVAVICGIHIDHATSHQLQMIMEASELLLQRLCNALQKE